MPWQNLQKNLNRFRQVPPAVEAGQRDQLKTEVDDLVAAQKAAAPVGGPGDEDPGKFRDSIHAYPNPNTGLISFRIVVDARDVRGHFVGSNIEFGHRAANGQHVPGRPTFFPIYRARRKIIRRRLKVRAAADALQFFQTGGQFNAG